MTDKQIIDVTQCPYYREGKTCTYLPYKSKCEGDCNWTAYKEMEEQLKRKEQECEELKKQHQADKGLITSTGKMNYQLLQEYDKLKAENEQFKKAEEYDSRYNDMQAEIDCGNTIIQKYEKCLIEIKEIADRGFKNSQCNCGAKADLNLILQKISECEAVND